MASCSQHLSACPVCGVEFDTSIISSHVQNHFDEDEMGAHTEDTNELAQVKCTCPEDGCSVIVNKSELDDHLLAHAFVENTSLSQEHSLPTSRSEELNDSVLARLIDEDLNEETNCQGVSEDAVIARQLQEEETASCSDISEDERLAMSLQKKQEDEMEKLEFRRLQEQFGMNLSGGGYMKQHDRSLSKSVAHQKVSVGDYFKQRANAIGSAITGVESGETQTKGILESLKLTYMNGVAGVETAALCISVDHISVGAGDQGWGCGYRNTQMILSALLNNSIYSEMISSKLPCKGLPSVNTLQQLIETAWSIGFDVAGAEQLGGKLKGTRKWIGSTEIAALLRSMHIRARIVDFHKPTGDGNTHPAMFEWIRKYFNQTSDDSPLPLYLQHQGHSRLCIGYEQHNSGVHPLHILLFDPSHSPVQMKKLLDTYDGKMKSHRRLLRRSIKQMQAKQYQIVYVDGLIVDQRELQESKMIHSVRIPP